MDLNRFCIKFLARPETNIDDVALIEIFHEWIRLRKLKGTLIDDGQFGLYAQRKLGEGETNIERILDLARATATFGALLESDSRVAGKLSLEGGQFLYMANDRLHAPNTDETFAALKPDLEAAAAQLYPGQSVSIARLENDPRDRLTAVVKVENSMDMATLAQAA